MKLVPLKACMGRRPYGEWGYVLWIDGKSWIVR